jgi:putative heme-binding domain-containing protein
MFRVRLRSVTLGIMMSVPLAAIGLRAAGSASGQQAGAGDLVKSISREAVMARLTDAAWTSKPVVEDGKALFAKVCAGCHIFGEIGASIGPDLTTLSSRFKKRDILDSILWPSKTVSDQYQVTLVELADGSIQAGLIFREDRNYLYIKNADHLERPLAIKLTDIKDRAVSTVSMMPEGLLNELTLQQVDSLVAYLLAGPK